MLVCDVTPKMLTETLKVRGLHVNKLMRAIDELRMKSAEKVEIRREKSKL